MDYIERYISLIREVDQHMSTTRTQTGSTPDWPMIRFLLAQRFDHVDYGVSVFDIAEEDPSKYYKYINPATSGLTGVPIEDVLVQGYNIIDTLWDPAETPMLLDAHDVYFKKLSEVEPALRHTYVMVAVNSIRQPDGSYMRMLTIARMLTDIIPNEFSSFIALHYRMPDATPPFAVTSFESSGTNVIYAQQLQDTKTALDGNSGSFFDEADVQHFERHRRFLDRLSRIAESVTPAEERVCVCIVEGMATKEIADHLHLSRRTVENHRLSIRKKLQLLDGESLTTVLQRIMRQPVNIAHE